MLFDHEHAWWKRCLQFVFGQLMAFVLVALLAGAVLLLYGFCVWFVMVVQMSMMSHALCASYVTKVGRTCMHASRYM